MDESGDRVRLTDLQDLKIVSSEDDSFFPSNIRSQILEQIRQSDGDFCDYNSAFSLILSLCQEEEKNVRQCVPDPCVYAYVLEAIETKFDTSLTASAFLMLKQLQGLSKQDLKDKVWRPKLDDHWVYFMSLLQKLGKLESSSSYSSYVVESEEAEKKRKRKRSSSGGGNRSAKRKKMDKNMEFLDLIMSEQEMGDDEKKKIQLQNLRYVLEYLVGLFQENISYNPSREDNALHILLSCPSSAASSFGGNMEDRIRNLLDQIFIGFGVGGNQTCNLMQKLLYLLFRTYGVTNHCIKPYLPGHFERLSDAKRRSFLETIKSQEHRMKVIDLILSQFSSNTRSTPKKNQAASSLTNEITVEKIVFYHLKMLPKEKEKGHSLSRNERLREEEFLCMLISFLVQSFILEKIRERSLSREEREELRKAGEQWVKKREHKADDGTSLFSYLHRTSVSLALLQNEHLFS